MSQETLNKLGAGALKFDSRMMNDPSMGYFATEQKRIQDDYHKELARIGASELRAEELSLEQAKLVKRKSADPLNASE